MLPSQQNASGFDLQQAEIYDTYLVPMIFAAATNMLLTCINALPFDDVFWLSRRIAPPFRDLWNSEAVGRYQLNAQFCEVRIP